jgi:hypothetical protein
LKEIGYEDSDKLMVDRFGKDYNPAADVTDQRSQVPAQSLAQPSGKALTSLSLPPPLPPPPAPVAAPPGFPPKPVPPAQPKGTSPKNGAPKGQKPTKGALLEVVEVLKGFRTSDN